MNIKMLNFTNHLRRQALIFGFKSKHKTFKLFEINQNSHKYGITFLSNNLQKTA